MKTKEEVSDIVNDLIEKNTDTYKGFIRASEKTEDMHLRDFLIDQATDRKIFAAELSHKLKSYNPDVDVDGYGTLTGSFHQSWLDLKAMFGGNTDKSILEECIRADRASVEDYEAFLKDYSSVSPEIDELINKQLQIVTDSLDNQFRLENIS